MPYITHSAIFPSQTSPTNSVEEAFYDPWTLDRDEMQYLFRHVERNAVPVGAVPTAITWDDGRAETLDGTWVGVILLVVKEAIDRGLEPNELPMQWGMDEFNNAAFVRGLYIRTKFQGHVAVGHMSKIAEALKRRGKLTGSIKLVIDCDGGPKAIELPLR